MQQLAVCLFTAKLHVSGVVAPIISSTLLHLEQLLIKIL